MRENFCPVHKISGGHMQMCVGGFVARIPVTLFFHMRAVRRPEVLSVR